MPARIIREGILSSVRINSLDWATEVFFRRLMNIVDDYGRHESHPTLLRSRCYPLLIDKVGEKDINQWLNNCKKAELLKTYKVDGKTYLTLLTFNQPTRSASKCPAPPGTVDSGKKAIKDMSDAEYLKHLEERYPSLDVKHELKRAEDWCGANNRSYTRRFIVSWLGRAKPASNKEMVSATGETLEKWD
jgi:hypothetical protein